MHLDPATAVFEGMLEGWARQQRTRFLKWDSTIKPRMSLVRRLARFSNQYPWEWQPAEVEAFFDNVRANNPNFSVSTARQYQNSLRMFCDFICDARYGWLATCQDGSGGFRCRFCTSTTALPMSPSSKGSRVGGR